MVKAGKPDGPVLPRPQRAFNRRQVAVQILVSVVILVSGIGIGAGGTILALRDRIIWKFPPPPPGGDRRWDSNDIIDRWGQQYNLTDDQKRQVKETFTQQFTAMREVFTELQEKEQTRREQFVTSMETILGPEQFEKWEREFRERGERWRRMRPFGRPGSGPGRHGPSGRGPWDGRKPERRRDHPGEGPREMKGPGPRPTGPPPEDATPPQGPPAGPEN